jgi:hypothetical protein
MTVKITAAVMVMLTIGGCTSAAIPQQRPVVVDDRQCQSYGARPGEPAYVACLTQLDMGRTGRSCFGSCH